MTRMLRATQNGMCERTSDAKELALWKRESERHIKTEIMEQLAKACGYGVKLVQYWGRDKLNPSAIEFFEACTACYDNELPGYFLSGSALEEWYSVDWRGKKAQIPTPMQLFERAMMVYARLQDERVQDEFQAPAVKRVLVDLDTLPSPRTT